MIKVFTLNKDKKIELTKEELQKLLDDSYWEGYRANNNIYTYTSPSVSPWTITYGNSTTGTPISSDKITLTCNSATAKESNIENHL